MKSLRMQLLSRSLIILACLLLLIGGLQYVLMQQFLIRNKAGLLQSQILALPHEFWLNAGAAADIRRPGPGPFSSDSAAAFIDANGRFTVVADSADGSPPPRLSDEEYRQAFLQHLKPGEKIVKTNVGHEQLVVLQPVLFRNRVAGLAQISTSMEPIESVLFGQLTTFFILAGSALVAGLLAFLPILRRTLVPLSNIVNKVERIDAGSLGERLPAEQGQAEIDRLSRSFNRMLERLEASFEAEKEAKERMRQFVADASHELRTPLTSIHGFLEVLLRGAAHNPDQLHKALTSMYGESERIRKLVQDLLTLSHLDRTPGIRLEEGELDPVVLEMEPQLRLLAGKRDVAFTLQSGGSPSLFDKDKIKQVLLNLFHNAVQHTDPETGSIRISTSAGPEEVVLEVRDNGCGIPEEHLPRLFERFYRIESSRSRKFGGAGLGLSIVKSIVDLHGGRIEAESREGQGSAFRMILPRHSS